MFTKGMILTTVSIAAICFAASGAVAAERQRPVTHMRGAVHRVISSSPGSVTLYDQNSDDAGYAILSTNFDFDYDSYDAYGADDFAIPKGHVWRIREIEVSGIYGQGTDHPAVSENVLFYFDNGGLPGKLATECNNLSGNDNSGSFAIKLPRSCGPKLKGGHTYWISVVANEGEAMMIWAWETRGEQNGSAAAWENPNDGLGTGCVTWDVMRSCVGSYGEGPDFMFTLKGKDVVTR